MSGSSVDAAPAVDTFVAAARSVSSHGVVWSSAAHWLHSFHWETSQSTGQSSPMQTSTLKSTVSPPPYWPSLS